jgi:transposase
MSIVMGFDQHRAQISAEWIETITGEISRARIRPADRVTVREFLEQFAGCGGLEVALEATTGWRFVAEELQQVGADVHLAEPAEAAALKGNKKRAKTDWADARHLRELLLIGRLPESWIPPAHLLDLRARVRTPALVITSADRVAAADPLGALSPRHRPAAQPAH